MLLFENADYNIEKKFQGHSRENRGIILQGHENISDETIQICHSHKMQLIL